MKRIFFYITCVVFALLLSGCGKKQDCKLLENASVQTSALVFYYFDGEHTYMKWLYDSKEEQRIVDEINKLKTTKLDDECVADLNVPCYGLCIGDREGFEIWLTYSNGLWLTKDGSVYNASYDLKKAYDSVAENDESVLESGLLMVNSAILGKHDIRFYKKSEELGNEKDGMSLSFVKYEGNVVTVTIQNNSEEERCYGTYFTLQKEIDGAWYTLPPRLSNHKFNDIAAILLPHSGGEETCDLTMYGEVENGHYRIEKEGMVADFYVK